MNPGPDILVLSNGHGEDEIGRIILDRLVRSDAERRLVAAWPMVGDGTRYHGAGIATFGPENRLPGEGFGTLSLAALARDLRAGFLGTYFAQARFARRLEAKAILAVGDIVPLAAAALSGIPTIFFSSAKSARYGGTDGHNALERALMRRTRAILVRDGRTAKQLGLNRVRAEFVGNPMMDGLEGADGSDLRSGDLPNVALLPGTRTDALSNARLLLSAIALGRPVHGIVAAARGFDLAALSETLPPGWEMAYREDLPLILGHERGSTACVWPGRFADALAASEIAIGMAGTGNEQAAGLGLPLVNVPGAGNQGAAFHAMKSRYFGAAAIGAPHDTAAISAALEALLDDSEARADMAIAGRELMGPPGAADEIAGRLRALAGWEAAHG